MNQIYGDIAIFLEENSTIDFFFVGDNWATSLESSHLAGRGHIPTRTILFCSIRTARCGLWYRETVLGGWSDGYCIYWETTCVPRWSVGGAWWSINKSHIFSKERIGKSCSTMDMVRSTA